MCCWRRQHLSARGWVARPCRPAARSRGGRCRSGARRPAGTIDHAVDFDTPGFQQPGDEIGGAPCLESEFGVRMDVSPNACQIRMVGAHSLEHRGRGSSLGHCSSLSITDRSLEPRILKEVPCGSTALRPTKNGSNRSTSMICWMTPGTPTHSKLCLGVRCSPAVLALTAKFAETEEKTIMQAVICLPR